MKDEGGRVRAVIWDEPVEAMKGVQEIKDHAARKR
jgi:hypothetical protein